MRNLIIYFKSNDGINCRLYDGVECRDGPIPKMKEGDTLNHICEILSSQSPTDTTLVEYYLNYKQWSHEIKEGIKEQFNNDKFNKGYRQYKTDFDIIDKPNMICAIRDFFFLFFGNCPQSEGLYEIKPNVYKKKLSSHQPIDRTEYEYIERTYNAGLMYVNKSKSNEFNEIKSFDMNKAYQWCLGSHDSQMKIPYMRGKEKILDDISLINKMGIYHLKITPLNDNAYKFFSFNHTNWYNYYDVKTVLKNPNYFNIELIQDGKPNAYVYGSKKCIRTNTIFNKDPSNPDDKYDGFYWYPTLFYLYNKYPTNKLVKLLGSMLWGIINEHNQIKTDSDDPNLTYYQENYEFIRMKSYGSYGEDSYKEIYYYRKNEPNSDGTTRMYAYNLRLKGWINSYCRYMMSQQIIPNIENVVRSHTDSLSIIANPNIQINRELFKEEDKSSGLIRFANVNVYFHKCLKCESVYKFKESKNNERCVNCIRKN
jgi:hypothetical protein